MAYYTDNMTQLATRFVYAGGNGLGGMLFTSAELHQCRWQDVAVLYKDVAGEEQVSSAVVYVDSLVAIGDYLVLGDQSGLSSPDQQGPNFRQVKQVQQSPSLDGGQVLVKAFL